MASVSGFYNLDCKKKYVLSREYRDDSSFNPNLNFGVAYHEAIEKGVDEGVKHLNDKNMYSSIPLLEKMKDRLDEFLAKHKINILANEVKITKSFEGCDEKYVGYVDGVCEMGGKKYLLEFKTARNIDFTFTSRDSQADIYLSMYDGPEKVDGMIYIINRKAESEVIPVLKNGHLSTSKAIKSTAQDYLDAINRLYKSIDDAPDKVKLHYEWLKENEEPLIAMVIVNKTEHEKEKTRVFVEKLTREIDEINKSVKENGLEAYMNDTKVIVNKFKCGGCQWKERCLQYE